jgi:23S rRNA pseudouridine1911/1915/1917 synthase
MPFQQLVVDGGSVGMRLDLFLARHFLNRADSLRLSRSGLQRLIAEGQVTLNGRRVKCSARVNINDFVQIEDLPPREIALQAEALGLEILYEDQDCIVINKAPGMVVHPAAGRSHGTVVNALLHHCPDLVGIGGERRPGIVHRLDKDTSGAMIIAKNDWSFQQLARQFKERTVSKEYLALAWGKLEPRRGIVDRAIGRHCSDRKRMSSIYLLAKGRAAITEWTVEKYFARRGARASSVWLTWVRIKPWTGRTHQIRVHLADLKHPLVGDPIYGYKGGSAAKANEWGLDFLARQALHAEKLGIHHPRTGQRMNFFAPLAPDLCSVLDHLRAQSMVVETVCDNQRD